MSEFTKVDISKLKTQCIRCKGKTELQVRCTKPKKKPTYYYNLRTYCKACKMPYNLDCSKVFKIKEDLRLDQQNELF